MDVHKNLSSEAEKIARAYLEKELPQRWAHVEAVALKARKHGNLLFAKDKAQIITAAAWLHDLGYASVIKKTGYHPLDGALWLRSQGFDETVVSLVAHHSCAGLEAEVRGLGKVLDPFPKEETLLADLLLFADMTTGPSGEDFSVQERMDEIVSRYGKDHVVSSFILKAKPLILEASTRVESKLKSLSQEPSPGK